MHFEGFDWDAGNWPKCGKHGVGRDEIELVFGDPTLIVGPDAKHSDIEQRFIAVGKSPRGGRMVLVIFTVRYAAGAAFCRPVSARFMHHKEVRKYDSDFEG